MNEADLVRRAQNRETEAFARLVEAHERFVYNLALRATGLPQDAEDVAQEAFLKAWIGLPHFRGQSSFRTWLYRITVNLCYNRSPRMRQELEQSSIEEIEAGLSGGSDPADFYQQTDRQAFLHREIASLPEGWQVLVTLRYQMELSYEEIAEIMELPLGTVKTHLHRMHQGLKKALLRYEEALV